CEEVYYLLYPLLLNLARRYGWRPLIAVAYLLSVAVAWTDPTAGDYPVYGWQLNWVLGLPCWLLGCLLAQQSDRLIEPVSRACIWRWRLTVWVAAGVLFVLRAHTPIGYPHTLNLLAILVYFWLCAEICYNRQASPPRVLEWAGKWSYSLYLVHQS